MILVIIKEHRSMTYQLCFHAPNSPCTTLGLFNQCLKWLWLQRKRPMSEQNNRCRAPGTAVFRPMNCPIHPTSPRCSFMIQLSHSVQTAHKQALLSSSTISFEPALALAWEQSKADQNNYTEETFPSNTSLCLKRGKEERKDFSMNWEREEKWLWNLWLANVWIW